MTLFYITISTSLVLCLILKNRILFFLKQLFFYRRWYIQELIRELPNQFSECVDQKKIFDLFTSKITLIIPIQHGSLYYQQVNHEGICCINYYGTINPSTLLQSKYIWPWLSTYHRPLVKKTVVQCLKKNKNDQESQQLLREMNQLHASICLPLFSLNQLKGLLILGPLPNNASFSKFDINSLFKISVDMSLSLQHAAHYYQNQDYIRRLTLVQQFSRKIINKQHTQRQLARLSTTLLTRLFQFKDIIVLNNNDYNNQLFPIHIHQSSLLSIYQYPLYITPSLQHLLTENAPYIFQQDSPITKDNDLFWNMIKSLFPDHHYIIIPLKKDQLLLGLFIGISEKSKEPSLMNNTLLPIITDIILSAKNQIDNFKKIQKAEHFNTAILAQIPVGIMILKNTLDILSINKTAETLLGQPLTRLKNKPISTLYPLCHAFQHLEEIIFSGKSINVETQITLNNDQTTPIYLSIKLINHNVDNESFNVICVLTDLSSIQRLQLQLEQYNRLSTLGVIAASIAHEIKNPLVSIKAFAQLLPKNWDNSEFRNKFATLVDSQLNHINNMAQMLTHLGKPTDLTITTVDLTIIINKIRDLLNAELNQNSITLHTEIKENSIIKADFNQTFQVFTNLIMNSIQAIHSNGEITITTSQVSGGYIVITVCDNGCGMSKDVLEKASQPFFTTKKTGTGLGLIIVQNIIQRHQGHLIIDSTENKGSVFTLYWPTPDANILQFELDSGIKIQEEIECPIFI